MPPRERSAREAPRKSGRLAEYSVAPITPPRRRESSAQEARCQEAHHDAIPGRRPCECPGPRRFSNRSHVNVRARGGEARPTPTPRTAEGWIIWLTRRTPVTLERVTGTRRASPSAPAHEFGGFHNLEVRLLHV